MVQTYPGPPHVVVLIPEVKASLGIMMWKSPLNCLTFVLIDVVKKLCNEGVASGLFSLAP